MKGSIMK